MHDSVLKGGTVFDGLGSDGRPADVAIDGGRVVQVGRDVGLGRREIAVDGLAVTPGFIDPHAHSDMIPLMPDPQPFPEAPYSSASAWARATTPAWTSTKITTHTMALSPTCGYCNDRGAETRYRTFWSCRFTEHPLGKSSAMRA